MAHQNANTQIRRGWTYGILAQVFWGASSNVTGLVSKTLPSTLLIGLRHGIGAIFLGITIICAKRPVFKHLPWIHVILLGILAGALPDLMLTVSIRHCGPIIAALLARLEIPFGVLFAHLFLKENVTRKVYASSLLGIVGAVLISYKPGLAIDLHNSFYLGVIIGTAAGIAWGLSSVYAKFILNQGSDPLAVIFVRQSIGSVSALIATAFLISQPLHALGHLSRHDWLLILYLGIFSSGVAYLLGYYSLKYIDAAISQILLGISMVVTIGIGLLLRAPVSALQWLGIVIIIGSIYMIKAKPAPTDPEP